MHQKHPPPKQASCRRGWGSLVVVVRGGLRTARLFGSPSARRQHQGQQQDEGASGSPHGPWSPSGASPCKGRIRRTLRTRREFRARRGSCGTQCWADNAWAAKVRRGAAGPCGPIRRRLLTCHPWPGGPPGCYDTVMDSIGPSPSRPAGAVARSSAVETPAPQPAAIEARHEAAPDGWAGTVGQATDASRAAPPRRRSRVPSRRTEPSPVAWPSRATAVVGDPAEVAEKERLPARDDPPLPQ